MSPHKENDDECATDAMQRSDRTRAVSGRCDHFLPFHCRHSACTVQVWRERARQRQTLATLNDRMLADIGIDRVAANPEASKPYWRS